MQTIFERKIGSDGSYQITSEEDKVRISCNFLFDGTTGERTEIYLAFDVNEYEKAIQDLLTKGKCNILNENGAFLKLTVKTESVVNVHFGRTGGTQYIADEEAKAKDFLILK